MRRSVAMAYSRLVFLVDASCLQNHRQADPLGGGWGVYHSLAHARAALPPHGAWTFLFFSSQARGRGRTAPAKAAALTDCPLPAPPPCSAPATPSWPLAWLRTTWSPARGPAQARRREGARQATGGVPLPPTPPAASGSTRRPPSACCAASHAALCSCCCSQLTLLARREGDKRLLALLTHFQKHPPPVERRAPGQGGEAGSWAQAVLARAAEALREAPAASVGLPAPAQLLLFTRVPQDGAPGWLETLQAAVPPRASLACVDVSPVPSGGDTPAPPHRGLPNVIPLASMTLLPPAMDVPALLHLGTQHGGGGFPGAVCECGVAPSAGRRPASLGDAELTHCAWLGAAAGQQHGRMAVTLTAAVASEAVLPLPLHQRAACLRAHPDSAMSAALHILCCAGACACVTLTCGQTETRAVLVPVTHCAALVLPCSPHAGVPSDKGASHAPRAMPLERQPVCFAAAPGLLGPQGARDGSGPAAGLATSTPWPGVASALAAAHTAASKDDSQPAHWRAAMPTTSSRALDRALGDLAAQLLACCPPAQRDRASASLAERARSRAAALRALPIPAPARVFEAVEVVVADCVTRHAAYLATQEASCPPCGEFVKTLVTDMLRRVEPRHATEAFAALRAALPLTDVQLRVNPVPADTKRRRNTLAAVLLFALLLRVPDSAAAGEGAEEVPSLGEPAEPKRVASQVTKVLAPCVMLLQPVGAEGMTNFCGTHIVPHFGGCAPETLKCLYRMLGIGHPFGPPAQEAPPPDAAAAPEPPAAAAPPPDAPDGAVKGDHTAKGRSAAPRAAAPKAPKAVTAREAAALAMKRKATTRHAGAGRAGQGAKRPQARGGPAGAAGAHMSSQPSTGGVGARSPAHAVRRAGRGVASPAHGGARRALLTSQEQEEQEAGPASQPAGSPSDYVVPQTVVKRPKHSDVVPMSPAGARRAPNARLFNDVIAASPVPAKRGAAAADLVAATVAKRPRTASAAAAELPLPAQEPVANQGRRRSSAPLQHSTAWDAAAKAHAMAALTALSCLREQNRGEFVAAAFEEVPDAVLFPDYYTLVAAPVSLASLRWDLRSDAFASRSDFLAAVARMFANAQTYNAPQSQPHCDADTLRALFAAQMDTSVETPAPIQTQAGRRLRVWWSADKQFFDATVVVHAPQRGQVNHFVRYDDGFSEWLDVEDPQWRVQWLSDGDRPRRASLRARKDTDAAPPSDAAAGSPDWGQPADLLLALRRRSANA